jgi:tRNA-dihydrouridine synthase B
VSIPVIGNGDVLLPADDGRQMMAKTGCDAVMIGRGAVSNPWIFSQVNALLEKRTVTEVSLDTRRLSVILRYIDDAIEAHGETGRQG